MSMIQIPIIFEESKSGLQSFNCFVTENNGQLILIDGGIPHDAFFQYAEQTLMQRGYDFSDLDAIYLTHHHEDHVGLLPLILAKKQLPVYVHDEAIPRLLFDTNFLSMRIAFYEQFYTRMDCLADARPRLEKQRATLQKASEKRIEADYRVIAAGDKLGRFDIIGLPGHSTDSIGYYDAQTQELYAGDTILKNTSTNAIIDPLVTGEYMHANLLQRQSLETIKDMPIRHLYAGHQPIFSNVSEIATQKISRLNDKAQHLLTLLEQPMTGRQATQAFYNRLYERQFSLVLSEIAGQLDYLQQQQKITATFENGLYVFERNE